MAQDLLKDVEAQGDDVLAKLDLGYEGKGLAKLAHFCVHLAADLTLKVLEMR